MINSVKNSNERFVRHDHQCIMVQMMFPRSLNVSSVSHLIMNQLELEFEYQWEK